MPRGLELWTAARSLFNREKCTQLASAQHSQILTSSRDNCCGDPVPLFFSLSSVRDVLISQEKNPATC